MASLDALSPPPPAPASSRTLDVETGDGELDALLSEAAATAINRPHASLAASRQARARAEAIGNVPGRAYALLCEGTALSLLSDHEAALGVLMEAQTEMEPLGDLRGRSLVLGSLAGVHVSLGNIEDALDSAAGALRLARALGDSEQEAWMLAGLGNSYLDLGETDRAMEAGERALRLFGELDDLNGQARSHTVLGGALRHLGRLDEARIHHESALRIAEEAGTALNRARALHDLGVLEEEAGRLDAALGLHRRALALRREVGNRQAQSTSLLQIGRVLSAQGDDEAAFEALHEAKRIATDIGAVPRLADVEEALASAYERAGQPAEALAHLRRHQAHREAFLAARTQTRLDVAQVRAEAERARQEAEIARVRTEELGAANDELSRTLRDLRATQSQLVQAEKLASLGRLSAGLAHEIQNPLNFVANFADLNAELATELLGTLETARQTGAPPDADAIRADLEAIVDNARRVRDHARRADGIVRSLMGHVRDVGGERRPSDLLELLERAVSTVLGSSAVHVERDYADLPAVEVEPASVQRVFVNLLENARWAVEAEAARAGDGYVPTVRLATAPAEGGVEVRVEDNGVGIPLDHCTRVFEPFFTTKPAGEGTGLGLSLAYDIVTEGHGGTIQAFSRVGEGATFLMTLPV
jgi:signal transduction histidine kinase